MLVWLSPESEQSDSSEHCTLTPGLEGAQGKHKLCSSGPKHPPCFQNKSRTMRCATPPPSPKEKRSYGMSRSPSPSPEGKSDFGMLGSLSPSPEGKSNFGMLGSLSPSPEPTGVGPSKTITHRPAEAKEPSGGSFKRHGEFQQLHLYSPHSVSNSLEIWAASASSQATAPQGPQGVEERKGKGS